MLTGIKTARKMDSEDSLEAGQPLVPWDCAATFLDRLELQLSEAQVEAFALAHVQSHPLIRILAQFAASTTAWLDLFWKVSASFTEAQRVCVYSIEPAVHRLEVRKQDGLRPCRMWFVVTHHIARMASVMTGDEPLEVRSVEVSGSHLVAHYAPPLERDTAERIARTSEIPLGAVLDSLSLLGGSLGQFVRDGHLAFDPGVRSQLEQVPALAGAWGLTLTEAKVALSLAEGRSPVQIAEALGVAVGTVRVHLKHVYAKTETSGQRELAARVVSWRLRL